jgi:hypothetical protein
LFHWNIVKHTIEDIKSHHNEDIGHLHDYYKEEISKLSGHRDLIDSKAHMFEKQFVEEQAKRTAAQERIVLLEKMLTDLQSKDADRVERYTSSIEQINKLKDMLDKERQFLREEQERQSRQRFEYMKETWKRHEENVSAEIRTICKKYNIEYFGQSDVPFKGKPDNTILIGDLFTIYDAKSPANDDLENFPRYIKSQAESIKKYTKEAKVRNDIFLVVPDNTLSSLEEFTYDIGTYRAHVIPVQALEPIILNLKKIEDYEFAEDLDPEVKENLIRIVGKLVHDIKRSVQITNDVSSYLIGSIGGVKTLPSELIIKIEEQEKAEKFNPPQEQRNKTINEDEIVQNIKHIENNI